MATALPEYQSQIAQLVSLLGTQASTTSGSTTTKAGDVDALKQVFQSSMDAAGQTTPELQALIDSIFTEGATKIPDLTAAFANATGTRTTGNSSLQLALGDLNRQLSSTAVSALLQSQTQNRATAASAASKIADANSTETKNGSQTVVTTPKINPLVPLLAGFALNKADKSGMLDFFKNKTAPDGSSLATSPASGSVTGGDITTSSPVLNFNGGGLNSTYMGDDPTLGVATGASMDAASDFGDVSSLVSSASQPMDFGGLSNTSDLGPVDIAPSADFGTGVDFGSEDLGMFFANGGAINKMARGTQPVKGYADGGTVRNVDNMGPVSTASPLVSAINNNVTPAPLRKDDADATSATTSGDTGATGMTDASNTNGIVGTPAQNAALINGFISALAAPVVGPLGAMAMNVATGGKSLLSAAIGAAGQATGISGAPVGSVTVGNLSTPDSQDSTQGQVSPADADGPATGVSGDANSSADGSGSAASSSAGTSTDGSPSYSDGGPVSGAGDGTSDSIDAKVSDGEYIFPADVVRYFGTKRLDAMKAAVHIPARR